MTPEQIQTLERLLESDTNERFHYERLSDLEREALTAAIEAGRAWQAVEKNNKADLWRATGGWIADINHRSGHGPTPAAAVLAAVKEEEVK